MTRWRQFARMRKKQRLRVPNATIPPLAGKWTGRVYRDNDPRSPGRRVTITGEPDPKTGRCPVIDDARRVTKISTVRLYSSKYTRCPELEK